MNKIGFIIQQGKQILCNDTIKLTSHTKTQTELHMLEKGKCHRCSNKIGYKGRCVLLHRWGWFCANDMCLTLEKEIQILKNRMKNFLCEHNGKPSLVRVITALWSISILVVWIFISIKKQELAVLDENLVLILSAVWTAKVMQRQVEKENVDKVKTQ